ncbi:STAS domain-containing protein [Geodermatophilus telluris]|uniref:Anti-sigma factor antagonist n=1 Tax=Geodermatophilus telluris TaxID=1190417 RepID=A0A1G6PHJ7_9ACTN|nr:STAS domain-containing protein [Geodermatophilus telluris]SDC79508.1 STAS domain-containing protein [Geodermatophilus telluris]
MTTISPGPTDDLLTVETHAVDGAARLVLAGEVDCSTAPLLRRALDEAFADGSRSVTVDLEAVTFLDSAGLSTLAIAHRTAVGHGVRLRVLVGTRAVARALQVTGLWELLGVEQVEPRAGAGAA